MWQRYLNDNGLSHVKFQYLYVLYDIVLKFKIVNKSDIQGLNLEH